MRLTLIRHGWSGPREIDQEDDDERDLTDEGKETVRAIAGKLASWGERPAVLYCSPLPRAMQTAGIVGSFLNVTPRPVDELHPLIDPVPWMEEQVLASRDKRVVIVGHHDNLRPMLSDMNGGEHVHRIAMGEARKLKVDRDTGRWEKRWRLKPSDLGLRDRK